MSVKTHHPDLGLLLIFLSCASLSGTFEQGFAEPRVGIVSDVHLPTSPALTLFPERSAGSARRRWTPS